MKLLDFFKLNDHFLNQEEGVAFFKIVYEMFLQNEEIAYGLVAAALTSTEHKLHKRSVQLIKDLFHTDYKLQMDAAYLLQETPAFKAIVKQGHRVVAHGVEEAKGGIANLLLMALTGTVKVPAGSWGNFLPGLPNISPLSHGPYYLIFSTKNARTGLKSNLDFSAVGHILVPFPEQVEELKNKMDRLQELRMISPLDATSFKRRLIDYKAFSMTLVIGQKRKRRAEPFDLWEPAAEAVPSEEAKVSDVLEEGTVETGAKRYAYDA